MSFSIEARLTKLLAGMVVLILISFCGRDVRLLYSSLVGSNYEAGYASFNLTTKQGGIHKQLKMEDSHIGHGHSEMIKNQLQYQLST